MKRQPAEQAVESNAGRSNPTNVEPIYAVPIRHQAATTNVEPVYQNYNSDLNNIALATIEEHPYVNLPVDHKQRAFDNAGTEEAAGTYDVLFRVFRPREQALVETTNVGNAATQEISRIEQTAVTSEKLSVKCWKILTICTLVVTISTVFVGIGILSYPKENHQNVDEDKFGRTATTMQYIRPSTNAPQDEDEFGTTVTTMQNMPPSTNAPQDEDKFGTTVTTMQNMPPSTNPPQVLCEVYYKGFCFRTEIRSKSDIDFPTAQAICRHKKSEVANVYSEVNYNLLSKHLYAAIPEGDSYVRAWIGLQYDVEKYTVTMNDGKTPAPYLKWYNWINPPSKNMFIHVPKKGSAGGMVTHPPKLGLHGVVCQSKPTDNPVLPEDMCRVEYQGKCFWLETPGSMINFQQANDACTKFYGTSMGNIYDVTHYNMIMKYLRTEVPSGISTMFILTGLKYDPVVQQATLSDGTTAPYEAWFPGVPYGEGTHIYLRIYIHNDIRDGMGNMYPSSSVHGVICEMAGTKAV